MRVALTFDTEFPGRPTRPDSETRILETLASAEIRATFFLQGRWTRANPDVARRIAEAGHLIGNHSNFHAPMDALSDEWLLEQLGYRHVGWELDPEDWDEGRTVDELVEQAAGAGIVLLHAWPAVTADGLVHLIGALREREAEFVGVDELD